MPDEEGFDAPNVEAAIREAADLIREMHAVDPEFGLRCRGRKLVISNRRGETVASFELGLSLHCFVLLSFIQRNLLDVLMDMPA
jgi:hypothetical protein